MGLGEWRSILNSEMGIGSPKTTYIDNVTTPLHYNLQKQFVTIGLMARIGLCLCFIDPEDYALNRRQISTISTYLHDFIAERDIYSIVIINLNCITDTHRVNNGTQWVAMYML